MVTSIIGTVASEVESFSQPPCLAKRLGPAERRDLALEVLAGKEPLSHLAERCGVSRNFLRGLRQKGREAVEQAVAESPQDEERVLYYIPVNKRWIRQVVLAQVLIGHSSYRAVGEIAEAVLDYRGLSLGKVHQIVTDALPQARAVNAAQDLGGIRVGAHDEIYQAGHPILVGADVNSTYSYLLAEEEHADETTWGVHLLDLSEQGLAVDYTVADGGHALRAGQAAAWGRDVPCHGDVFHAERDLGNLAFYLEHRAAGCTTARVQLERQMERCKKRHQGHTLSKRLAVARQAEARAVPLAQDVRLLADWVQNDILSLAGPSLPARQELFDFVVQELARREELCPHRIGPVRRALADQRDNLLAFAGVLEEEFAALADQFDVPACWVQQLCQLEGRDPNTPDYWQRQGRLRGKLREKFQPIQQAVRHVMAETPRASSVIENLNSRVRTYLFLRRDAGNDYLDLLRFYLNHHRFLRSGRPERVGKSPAELLTGESHPHWLELLGFQRFHRN